MYTLRLKASAYAADSEGVLRMVVEPYTGQKIGDLSLIAGRENGIELSISSAPLSVPEVVMMQMKPQTSKSLAQWVDKGVIEILNGVIVLTALQVLQLGYTTNKPYV
jgi:hypothetical protein